MIHRPHELDQLFVDDADDLFAWIERAQDLLAERLFGDPLDELVGHRVVDVGIQKSAAHFLQPVADIGFGQPAASAQLLEGLTQASLDTLEHDTRNLLPANQPGENSVRW